MSLRTDPAFNDWIAAAKAVTVVAELRRRGLKAIHEQNGPCPGCGGTDRFAVNLRKNVFLCRASGASGSAIDLCEHLDGTSFLASCETLTGSPPPGRDSAETPEERQARERRMADQARAQAEQQIKADQDEAADAARDTARCHRLFDAAAPICGNLAERYLAARAIVLPPGFGGDLRFLPALDYYGFADEQAQQRVKLGVFPAMVAPIRNVDGQIVGLHRTWLDPSEPRKLRPPGCSRRNGAKKVLGSARGMILLSPMTHRLVMGEGIESTLSAHRLGVGGPEACFASGVSLGNMSGAATGDVLDPEDPKKRLPNGVPDHSRPGVMLPDSIDAVILLVDGDSEQRKTWAHMCVAGRRFRDLEREVAMHCAAPGMDHNDMLMAKRRAAA